MPTVTSRYRYTWATTATTATTADRVQMPVPEKKPEYEYPVLLVLSPRTDTKLVVRFDSRDEACVVVSIGHRDIPVGFKTSTWTATDRWWKPVLSEHQWMDGFGVIHDLPKEDV